MNYLLGGPSFRPHPRRVSSQWKSTFLEDFAFHRLLAEEALQLFHLVLKRSVFGCRNDLFLRCRGRQRTLRRKFAPGE
jgi:hypothetical protein